MQLKSVAIKWLVDFTDIKAYSGLWCVTCHQINTQAATNYIKPGSKWPELWTEEAEPESFYGNVTSKTCAAYEPH